MKVKFIVMVIIYIKNRKKLQENLKKFREEAEKLEQSDALKKAREKYVRI